MTGYATAGTGRLALSKKRGEAYSEAVDIGRENFRAFDASLSPRERCPPMLDLECQLNGEVTIMWPTSRRADPFAPSAISRGVRGVWRRPSVCRRAAAEAVRHLTAARPRSLNENSTPSPADAQNPPGASGGQGKKLQ